jgi:hypothetical protein
MVSCPEDDHVAQHEKLPLLELLSQQNAPKSPPPAKNEYPCECCRVRTGVDFFDRRWCCAACGQAIHDASDAERTKPVPPKKKGK